MRINGTNHYIGRSTSGSYITSNSRLSTRLNTYTSGGYSAQYHTYTTIVYTNKYFISRDTYLGQYLAEHDSESHSWYSDSGIYTDTASKNNYNTWSLSFDDWNRSSWYATEQTYSISSGRETLTSTKNVYYATTMTNVANITVSTTKSASSSSHNFV